MFLPYHRLTSAAPPPLPPLTGNARRRTSHNTRDRAADQRHRHNEGPSGSLQPQRSMDWKGTSPPQQELELLALGGLTPNTHAARAPGYLAIEICHVSNSLMRAWDWRMHTSICSHPRIVADSCILDGHSPWTREHKDPDHCVTGERVGTISLADPRAGTRTIILGRPALINSGIPDFSLQGGIAV